MACGPSRGAYGGWTLRESARRGEEDGPDGRDPPIGWCGREREGREMGRGKELSGRFERKK